MVVEGDSKHSMQKGKAFMFFQGRDLYSPISSLLQPPRTLTLAALELSPTLMSKFEGGAKELGDAAKE